MSFVMRLCLLFLLKHPFQLVVFFPGNERVLRDAFQPGGVGPAAIGSDIPNLVQIDDVALVAAEEQVGGSRSSMSPSESPVT